MSHRTRQNAWKCFEAGVQSHGSIFHEAIPPGPTRAEAGPLGRAYTRLRHMGRRSILAATTHFPRWRPLSAGARATYRLPSRSSSATRAMPVTSAWPVLAVRCMPTLLPLHASLFTRLSCLASEARPVCLCSRPALKTDCGRYKACVAALSFARSPVCPVLAGRYVNSVVGSVQRREWSVVCMHRVR